MRFLLFDADYTLLDFPADMVRSFKIMYDACFSGQRPYSKELLDCYDACNNRAWDRFERGECTKHELYISRFVEFLSETGLSGDPEDVNEKYFTAMAETGTAYPGAVKLVKDLSKTYELYMITNGNVVSALPRIKNSGLAPYFRNVFVSEAVGVGKPDKRYFDYVAANIPGFSREEAVVIGDSLSSDIQGAVNAGLRSIWFAPRGEARPEAGYTWRAGNYYEIKRVLRHV